MFTNLKKLLGAAVLLPLAPLSVSQAAESGLYAGGSIGTAAIEVDITDIPDVPPFDEDDFAWKIYGGYNFGLLPMIDLGVEGGYVNFGGPSLGASVPGASASVDIETTAIDLFGVVGFGIGPLDVFGKVGYVFWDADLTASLIDEIDPDNSFRVTESDDGNDLAYGVGARLGLGSLEVRAEYELFDIEDTEDVSMWSVGLAFYFN